MTILEMEKKRKIGNKFINKDKVFELLWDYIHRRLP